TLVGDLSGAVLLQQTASNLAVAPGATVAVQPPSGPVRHVRISGVAAMPQEDSFFQTVGAPAGAGPSAPPDNVLVVPSGQFSAVTAGATVIHQVHVGFDHTWLPADPARAAAVDAQARNHFEATLAGAGLVGDNLAAALSAAREDALYGELLFLLLGLPAFLVALAVTALVLGARGERRLRELALLRLRGARNRELAAATAGEAAAVLLPGVVLGWPVASRASRWAFGSGSISWLWFTVGALCLVVVVAAVQLLALRRLVRLGNDPLPGVRTVEVPQAGRPWPLRVGLDYGLL